MSIASYVTEKKLRFLSLFTSLILSFIPPTDDRGKIYTIFFSNLLHNSKKCSTFVVEIYAGGKYVLRKVFRMVSSKGRFLTYLIAFIDALLLANRNFATFE